MHEDSLVNYASLGIIVVGLCLITTSGIVRKNSCY